MSEALAQPSVDTEDGIYARRLLRLEIPRAHDIKQRPEVVNTFLRTYPDWYPHWEAEIADALVGIDRKMSYAYDAGGLSRASKPLENAYKYRDEASKNVTILSKLRNSHSPELMLSAEEIKDDPETMEVLAEHLLAVRELDRFEFKPHMSKEGQPNQARRKRIAGIMQDLTDFSDANIQTVFSIVRGREVSRLRFWDRQLDDVLHTPIARAIIDNIQIITDKDMEPYLLSLANDFEDDAKI